jgi:hypothetical protein
MGGQVREKILNLNPVLNNVWSISQYLLVMALDKMKSTNPIALTSSGRGLKSTRN